MFFRLRNLTPLSPVSLTSPSQLDCFYQESSTHQPLPVLWKDSQTATFSSRCCSPSLNCWISWKKLSPLGRHLIFHSLCPIMPPKWLSLELTLCHWIQLSIVLIISDLGVASVTADHWSPVLVYSCLGSVILQSLDFLTTFLAALLESPLLDTHLCPDPSVLHTSPSFIISSPRFSISVCQYVPCLYVSSTHHFWVLALCSQTVPRPLSKALGNRYVPKWIYHTLPQPAYSPVSFT